jgi:hypothetical protein
LRLFFCVFVSFCLFCFSFGLLFCFGFLLRLKILFVFLCFLLFIIAYLRMLLSWVHLILPCFDKCRGSAQRSPWWWAQPACIKRKIFGISISHQVRSGGFRQDGQCEWALLVQLQMLVGLWKHRSQQVLVRFLSIDPWSMEDQEVSLRCDANLIFWR